MRAVTLLALSALAVALSLLVWCTPDSGAPSLPGEVGGRLLSGLDAEAVQTLTLTRADGSTVTLQREDSGWSLTSGSGAGTRARGALVRRLLAELEYATVRRTLDSAARAEELGLKPARVVLVATAAGRSWRVELGRPDPSGTSVYARKEAGGPILALDHTLLRAADLRPAVLRDPRLVPAGPAHIVLAKLKPIAPTSTKRAFSLRRTPRGWTVDDGAVVSAADPLTSGRFIAALSALQVSRFNVPTGEFHSIFSVDVRWDKGRVSLTVGDVCPETPAGRAVRVGGGRAAVVCVAQAAIGPLEVELGRLRDRALLRDPEPYLSQLSLRGEVGRLTFRRRDDGDWATSDGELVDQLLLRAWVERLSEFRSLGRFARWSEPPSEVAARLSWTTEAGGEQTLVVGRPEGEVVKVWRHADKVVLPVGRQLVETLAQATAISGR